MILRTLAKARKVQLAHSGHAMNRGAGGAAPKETGTHASQRAPSLVPSVAFYFLGDEEL